MRTLKKTLCLVLALVMMLGLCAVNVSAASYTDDASVGADYREAIEVLSGIGVFNGKDDGSLGPQDSLTRVQGCYLICKMMGAPNGAGFTSFTDVSAQDSPIVAYCQTLGIVNGYGDNTFHPYDPLTGAAFAKFCLVALGYNAAVENMTGLGWMTGTQQLTTMVGLDDGIPGYNQAATITREQAAQMCLNTLEATMVEYPTRVDITNTDGSNVNVVGARSPMANKTDTDYRTSKKGLSTMEFAEMYFPQLKQDDKTEEVDKDNLNAPLEHIWNYRGSELYRTLDTPIITYTGKTDKSVVSADLSSYYVVRSDGSKMYINNATTYSAAAPNPAHTLSGEGGTRVQLNGFYVDGNAASENIDEYTFFDGTIPSVSVGTPVETRTSNTLTFRHTTNRTLANVIADITANGRKVDFYANDDDNPNRITDIVITGYTVAKVRTISTSGTTTSYTFTGAQSGSDVNFGTKRTYGDSPADNTLITEASLSRDDYVTITYPGSTNRPNDVAKIYVYATEMFTGVQTGRSSNNFVTIDGSNYNVATGVFKETNSRDDESLLTTAAGSDDFSNSNSTSNFFTDQYGYLVHSDAVSSGNYAFIVGASGRVDNSVDGETPEISVRAVLSDGTVSTYKVATEKRKITTSTAAENRTVLYPNNNFYQTGSITTDDVDVYLIKNTNILVGDGGVGIEIQDANDSHMVDWVNNDTWANNAAKILMSSANGYLYNYSVNAANDTITLTPVNTRRGERANAYRTNNTGTYTEGTVYSGETTGEILKGSASYGVLWNNGEATLSGGTTDPKTAGGTNAGTGTGSTSTGIPGVSLLVNASTPIIVYNNSNRTASVIDGLSNMPSDTGSSGVGYFAGTYNTGGGSFTAKTIFVTKGGGVSASTKEYIYVKATEYEMSDEDGTTVYYFQAFHEDGSFVNFFVKDDVDDELIGAHGANDADYSGLYTANANNVLTGVALRGAALGDPGYSGIDTGHGAPTNQNPYAYIPASKLNSEGEYELPIENNMIHYAGSDEWFYLNDAVYVYPNGDKSLDEADGAYIVLTVDGGTKTAYVKTIYVL